MRLALRILAYSAGTVAAALFVLVAGFWLAAVGGCCQ